MLRQRYSGRLAPPLEGLAYRFTIWLPVQAKGRPVFSGEQRLLLYALFRDCFGGFSQSSLEGFPPWSGSWLPAGTDEPIVDHHILLIVYSLQDVGKGSFAQCRQVRPGLTQVRPTSTLSGFDPPVGMIYASSGHRTV